MREQIRVLVLITKKKDTKGKTHYYFLLNHGQKQN